MRKAIIIFTIILSGISTAHAQQYSCKIGLLKYRGGGDWYANLETSLKNLVIFTNRNVGTNIDPQQEIVEVGSAELFNYPWIHMTGHGNVAFSDREAENLRNYLIAGGFLHIDDNYGMDLFVRREMKKVFPEADFVELPWNHSIYHQEFDFNEGLPKIHEHDGKEARGFGIFWNGRLVCFYSSQSDLGDGWESAEVHKDSQEKRMMALKMGANILQFTFMGDEIQ
ncbi:MAG: DUF4159 domain-containing protein [Vicingaceae bacterium]